jgi:hypothetical protein
MLMPSRFFGRGLVAVLVRLSDLHEEAAGQ